MPKMRTRKTAAKRLEFTGSGNKIKFRSNFNSHLLTRKSSSRKRRLQREGILHASCMRNAKGMLPYGK